MKEVIILILKKILDKLSSKDTEKNKITMQADNESKIFNSPINTGKINNYNYNTLHVASPIPFGGNEPNHNRASLQLKIAIIVFFSGSLTVIALFNFPNIFKTGMDFFYYMYGIVFFSIIVSAILAKFIRRVIESIYEKMEGFIHEYIIENEYDVYRIKMFLALILSMMFLLITNKLFSLTQ